MKIEHIPEPKLTFKNDGEAFHPQFGLRTFGPRGPSDVKSQTVDEFLQIRLGIIGSEESIDAFQKFLKRIEKPIPADPKKPVSYSFPGIGLTSPLKFNFITDQDWIFEIPPEDLAKCGKGTVKENARMAIEIFESEFEKANIEVEPKPDVFVISIPKYILKKCSYPMTRRRIKIADRAGKYSSSDIYDFHNYLKIIAMQYPFVTQFVKPRTLDLESKGRSLQEPSERAWNLTMAIYYKATGIPWKLAHFPKGTCFVGIGFVRIFTGGRANMQATMTQVFLKSGEHFVLRGEPFHWEHPKIKSPHLTKDQAANLVKQIISVYKGQKKKLPERIVIQKTSQFWDDELEGFDCSSENIPEKDFLTIQKTDFRIMHPTEYAVVRGSLLKTKKELYLFTTGFTPVLKTYPGPRIPMPLRIILYHPSSKISKICSEILALSKMDWNKTSVATRLPVTLEVARRIGNILSEPIAQKIDAKKEYRYYM